MKSELGCVGIIVSARFSSNRLPGKAMLDVGGHSMLGFLLSRLKTSQLTDRLVLATSDRHDDDVLKTEAEKYDVLVYRGSLDDVVERNTEASQAFGIDTIIRLTGDNPFIDGSFVDGFVSQLDGTVDTLYTTRPFCPKGLNVEIFSAELLYRLNDEMDLSNFHREHLTTWFYNNKFNLEPKQFELPNFLNNLKLTFSVDTQEDYEKVLKYINGFDDIFFKPEQLIEKLLATN